MERQFPHERLVVYRRSVEFFEESTELVRLAGRPRRYPADQLDRAATSIVLNIAEGAGEFSRKEKARFHRMALRSATESAAILDLLSTRLTSGPARVARGRSLLFELIAMLTRLARHPTTGDEA